MESNMIANFAKRKKGPWNYWKDWSERKLKEVREKKVLERKLNIFAEKWKNSGTKN